MSVSIPIYRTYNLCYTVRVVII
ncbi:hypothetical protein Q604_UNBC05067G0001, partial [human gut metagenome]